MIRTLFHGVPLLIAAFVAMISVSCASDPREGYSTATLYPQGVRTVAVHIFENSTFERDIEFQLADALVKEIEARTPYKVASGRSADSVLTGRITSVTRELLSRSSQTSLAQEMMLNLTVEFSWRDQRTDRVLAARESFAASSLFVPSAPSSEPHEVGEFAAVQQLARDLVEEMRSAW